MIRLKNLINEASSAGPVPVIGNGWSSNSQWQGHRSEFIGQSINVDISDSNFKLEYTGKPSGISIAHAKGGTTDTLHQLFNVVLFELNPYLATKKLEPMIDSINTRGKKLDKGIYNLVINIPLMESNGTWQINRRGGWGHTGGLNDVKSQKFKGVVETKGPVTVVTDTKHPWGPITEYFMAYKFQ